MIEQLLCPICEVELKQNYGLMGLIRECPKCKREWIKCLGKLVTRGEFHERAEAEK